MNLSFACKLILIVQMMTMSAKPIVHLVPNAHEIDPVTGGKLLELINSPPALTLPHKLPVIDSLGHPWLVDIKNLGPGVVTVTGKGQFTVVIQMGQTIHIACNGSVYTVKR